MKIPMLPTLNDLDGTITVDELARSLYGPEAVYDTALPQRWLDEFKQTTGFNPVGQIVWGYPPVGCLLGCPLPLTQEAHDAIRRYESGD